MSRRILSAATILLVSAWLLPSALGPAPVIPAASPSEDVERLREPDQGRTGAPESTDGRNVRDAADGSDPASGRAAYGVTAGSDLAGAPLQPSPSPAIVLDVLGVTSEGTMRSVATGARSVSGSAAASPSHKAASPSHRPATARKAPKRTQTPRMQSKYGVPWLVRQGIASHMGSGFPAGYLALPHGPGWRARICGAGGCVTMTSNDAGPALYLQRQGRIADLSVAVFRAVCGVSESVGLCPVSVTILGRA